MDVAAGVMLSNGWERSRNGHKAGNNVAAITIGNSHGRGAQVSFKRAVLSYSSNQLQSNPDIDVQNGS